MASGEEAHKLDPLVPDDPRVKHLDAKIGEYNYHYMFAEPEKELLGTVLLTHGWPDLGMAWRYQVPFLTALGLRVIVPDLLGYGRTSAPADVGEYTFKKVAGHLIALVDQAIGEDETGEQIIVGGHDWGAVVAHRIAMWYPERVKAVFTLNVPFNAPAAAFHELEDLVKRVPSFKYQLQLASPVAENIVNASTDNLRQFFNGIYGGSGPNGELVFRTDVGIVEENIGKIGPAKLLSPDMVEYYVREYSRSGMHGPTNWYRTRKLNFEDEKPFAEVPGGYRLMIPGMVVMGEKDAALPPSLADGNERYFEAGLKKEVAAGVGHWAMWQDPETINGYIKEFLETVLGPVIKQKLRSAVKKTTPFPLI